MLRVEVKFSHIVTGLANMWGMVHGNFGKQSLQTKGDLTPINTTFYATSNANNLVAHLSSIGEVLSTIEVPPPIGSENSSPTGLVRNDTKGFKFSYKGRSPIKAKLIVVTEKGQVLAWNPKANSSFVQVYLAEDGAIYKDLALAGEYLYATDFFNGKVDVFDKDFNLQNRFSFVDPSGLPVNYKPFGIKSHDSVILVSYAVSGGDDDLRGNGFGVINAFDPADGGFLRRLVNVGGNLNSPFGFAEIPKKGKGFLSGNFGDGQVGTYDDISGHQKAVLVDKRGKPIVIPGLWTLLTYKKYVYFVGGGFDEKSCVFGRIEFL